MAKIIEFPNKQERDFREIDRVIEDSKLPNMSLESENRTKVILKQLLRKYPPFPPVPNNTQLSLHISDDEKQMLEVWLSDEIEKVQSAVRNQIKDMLFEIAILTLRLEQAES